MGRVSSPYGIPPIKLNPVLFGETEMYVKTRPFKKELGYLIVQRRRRVADKSNILATPQVKRFKEVYSVKNRCKGKHGEEYLECLADLYHGKKKPEETVPK